MGQQHAMQCMEIWGGSGAAAAERVDTPGLHATVLSRPFEGADEGGDIHYVTVCGSGRITRAILADVAGHGQAVAALARSLRELLRKNINFPSQKRVVRELNQQFGALTNTRVFASAVVVTYLTYRDTFTFCNAGHPRPLFYSASKKAWRLLSGREDEEGNIPLGILEGVPYNQFAVRCQTGDAVLLYTDYLVEARDAAGQALGEEGVLRLAADLIPDNPEEIARQLLERVDAYRGTAPPDDDASLMVLTRTADKSISWNPLDRLRVWGKVFGLVRT